jgi:hypothetical protein
MTTNDIIELLKNKKADFIKTKSFSQLPGIYAIFYIGDNFPILGNLVSKHQLIYIGKTESSQQKRDAETHFKTGKTGSSTVRKSIGSLLCELKKLKPIPRNESDYKKGRFSHFKFENESEEIITEWMINNLALSFYEYPENKLLIDKLETEIIKKLKPVLNIDHKNPENPYKAQLLQLRKSCAKIAMTNTDFKKKNVEKIIEKPKVPIRKFTSPTSGSIYIDNITESDVKSQKIRIKSDNKHLFPMEKLGNPISYQLNFKIDQKKFIATYTIGSKDGKSRSGILKLGSNIYNDALKIKKGANLRISRSKENMFLIEKM